MKWLHLQVKVCWIHIVYILYTIIWHFSLLNNSSCLLCSWWFTIHEFTGGIIQNKLLFTGEVLQFLSFSLRYILCYLKIYCCIKTLVLGILYTEANCKFGQNKKANTNICTVANEKREREKYSNIYISTRKYGQCVERWEVYHIHVWVERWENYVRCEIYVQ